MKLFLVYFESANYCGYGHHAVVRADSAEEAQDKAHPVMEEYFYEQDQDQYLEENGEDDGVVWTSFVRAEVLDKTHEGWRFVVDSGQAQFYEFIGVTQKELQQL